MTAMTRMSSREHGTSCTALGVVLASSPDLQVFALLEGCISQPDDSRDDASTQVSALRRKTAKVTIAWFLVACTPRVQVSHFQRAVQPFHPYVSITFRCQGNGQCMTELAMVAELVGMNGNKRA
jgi:hypothetical protein